MKDIWTQNHFLSRSQGKHIRIQQEVKLSKPSCLACLCQSLCKGVPSAMYSASSSRGWRRSLAEGQPPVEGLLCCGLNCHQCSHSALADLSSAPRGDPLSGRTGKRECWNTRKTTQHQGMLQSWKAKAVYNSKRRRNQAPSGFIDVTMDLKLRISCFISLQVITISVSSGCSVITIFPYLMNFNVTEILYSI